MAWTNNDRDQMTQAEFAEFLEDWGVTIAEPAAAAMLEIARTLEAKKGVRFDQATNLGNGEIKFRYEETVDASAGEKGDITIPEGFTIRIPIFRYTAETVDLTARFRYRIRERALRLSYILNRPELAREIAFGSMIETAEKELPEYGKIFRT